MKRTYLTGQGTDQIELNVSVGTVGVAFTSVYLSRSGGQTSLITQSDTSSGNINNINIGFPLEISGAYLIVQTTVDFTGEDEDKWENLAKTIAIQYILAGGLSGIQNYNYDTDDVDIVHYGRIVVITKPIELI